VLQHQPQKCRAGDRSGLPLLRLTVLITEGHLALFTGYDMLLLDDTPVEITAQVDQRLLARTDRLAVHHPLIRAVCREHKPFVGNGLQELGSKHFSQRLMIEQIGLFPFMCLGSPQPLERIDGSGRHHQVHVGVVIQTAGMGVQDRNRTGHAEELFIILSEGPHRLPDTLDHQGIKQALMSPGQGPKFSRQGEGQQKILGRHLLFQLAFQPLLALVMLAVGAMAVPTGMGYQDLAVTRGALHQHAGAVRGTTGLHGGQRLAMTRQDLFLVLLQERGLKGFDER